MVKYKIDLTTCAESDLRDIVHYVQAQLQAPLTAQSMLDVFEEALASLKEMPERCPLVRDERLAAMGYCKLLVKNYVVFYIVDQKNKVVVVERILYARRDWLRLL